jgi:tetratricopeptide (TPR) repeat protein
MTVRLREQRISCEEAMNMPQQSLRRFAISLHTNSFQPAALNPKRWRTKARLIQRGIALGGLSILVLLIAFNASAQQQAGVDQPTRQAMQRGAEAMKAGDFGEATSAYTAVTRSQPDFAEGYFNLGLALQQAGRLDDSRAALEKALHLKPALRGANLFLGIVAYRQNRFKDAELSLQRETRLDPRSASAFMWLGVCRLAQNDPRGAITPLDKAYALNPSDADILYHRGRAYLLVANASYDAMFKLNHDSLRVHQVLAEAYAQSYRNAEAISEFEIAIKMAPKQPGLHEELGDQYWAAGQLDKATPAYRAELGIDANATSAKFKLGSLLVLNQESPEGVRLLREVLRADPSLSDAHYYLGTGLMSIGQEQDAIHEFDLAIAANPSDDRAMTSYYKLAQIYRKLHQANEGQEAMGNFLRMRTQIKERQDQHAVQIARRRTDLPVEDPEHIAVSTNQ